MVADGGGWEVWMYLYERREAGRGEEKGRIRKKGSRIEECCTDDRSEDKMHETCILPHAVGRVVSCILPCVPACFLALCDVSEVPAYENAA